MSRAGRPMPSSMIWPPTGGPTISREARCGSGTDQRSHRRALGQDRPMGNVKIQ